MQSKMTPVLKDRITDILRQEIFSGNMKDGESFTQKIISEKLGVSRMPVREAFLQLESEGILKRLQNRHVEVVGVTKSRIRQNFSVIASMEIAMALELEEISILNEKFEVYKTLAPQQGRPTWVKGMIHFHMALSQSLNNPYLENLHVRVLTGYHQYLCINHKVDWKDLIMLNTDIMKAIESRDVKKISDSINGYFDYLVDYAIRECCLE